VRTISLNHRHHRLHRHHRRCAIYAHYPAAAAPSSFSAASSSPQRRRPEDPRRRTTKRPYDVEPSRAVVPMYIQPRRPPARKNRTVQSACTCTRHAQTGAGGGSKDGMRKTPSPQKKKANIPISPCAYPHRASLPFRSMAAAKNACGDLRRPKTSGRDLRRPHDIHPSIHPSIHPVERQGPAAPPLLSQQADCRVSQARTPSKPHIRAPQYENPPEDGERGRETRLLCPPENYIWGGGEGEDYIPTVEHGRSKRESEYACMCSAPDHAVPRVAGVIHMSDGTQNGREWRRGEGRGCITRHSTRVRLPSVHLVGTNPAKPWVCKCGRVTTRRGEAYSI